MAGCWMLRPDNGLLCNQRVRSCGTILYVLDAGVCIHMCAGGMKSLTHASLNLSCTLESPGLRCSYGEITTRDVSLALISSTASCPVLICELLGESTMLRRPDRGREPTVLSPPCRRASSNNVARPRVISR